MWLYSEKDLDRVRHVFQTACADLLVAHGGKPVERDQIGRCLDALLDALADREVVEESFRIEGIFPLAADELSHALMDILQAAPRVR